MSTAFRLRAATTTATRGVYFATSSSSGVPFCCNIISNRCLHSSQSALSSNTNSKGLDKAASAASLETQSTSASVSPSSSSSLPKVNPLKTTRPTGRDDASLARYPNLHSAGGLLRGLDYAGTITFALTGSVTAAQSGLDVFGCAMAGVVTAVGGGTIRDAVFLNRKPFWTEETEYIWMALGTGLLTFFLWPEVLQWQMERKKQIILQSSISTINGDDDQKKQIQTQSTVSSSLECYDELDGALDTLDAIGLSSFAIIGAQNGVRAGMPMLVSAICGMATSTFGGLTRDLLCGRPVRIVHSNAEVYAAPAVAGAFTYLATMHYLGASPAVRIGAAMSVCMGSRYVAVKNDVKLHTWDTAQDNLGVAVRKHPTVKPKS